MTKRCSVLLGRHSHYREWIRAPVKKKIFGAHRKGKPVKNLYMKFELMRKKEKKTTNMP
jgi:hypothetical protein